MTEERRAPPPVLRKETVDVPGLGEVVVRALKLSERLEISREGAQGDAFFARILAIMVTDKAGRPLYTADEWDIYGGDHQAEINQVLEVAMRLGGFGEAAAKNA